MRRASLFLSTLLKSRLSSLKSLNPNPLIPSIPKPPPIPSFPILPSPSRSLHSPRNPLPTTKLHINTIEERFEAATSTQEILTSFWELEAVLEPLDLRLGLACLKVGQHLDAIGHDDHDQVMGFSLRALKILELGEKDSVPVAMALHLVGSVCYNMKRFNEGLGYFSRANRVLSELERNGDGKNGDGRFDVRPISHAVHLQLANTKTAMGRREEALIHLKKCLEIKESIFDPSSRELGNAYRDLAEAYTAVLNFNEALPLCLKALEIHLAKLGQNSIEVAHDRRLLGVIYIGLERYEKALEENQESQKVLKNWGMSSDLLNAEIDAANIEISLGKYDEAVQTLKRAVHQTEKNSENRAVVYITMAKALSNLGKVNSDAKRCLEEAENILKGKEIESHESVSEAYVEIASIYEVLNDFDKAIEVLKRSLEMIERLPCHQHLEGNVLAKIGWLLLLTGKVSEAVPYLESAVERLKSTFGPKHFGVGYIYNNLGAAYMEMDRPQTAAQMFARAKDVMDVSLGPHHADAIEACQSLANAYAAMESYPLAMEFQKRVIDAWSSYGPGASEKLKEANQLYKQLEEKALGNLVSNAAAELHDYVDSNDDDNNEDDDEEEEEDASKNRGRNNGAEGCNIKKS